MYRKLLLLAAALATVIVCLNPVETTKADTTTVPTTMGTTTVSSNPVLYMRVTAYTSVPDETDDTPFTTANGTTVRDGIVASNNLPFGTKIEIPALFGNKIFTVEDRMNKKFKTGIDIWMPNVDKAIVFGANYANVIVLNNTSPIPASSILATNIQ